MKALLKYIGIRRLKEEKLRSFLTLFGIALGIALLTGIWLTSKSVINTFNRIVGQLRSSGDIYINRRGLLFNQSLTEQILSADPNNCVPYGGNEPGRCIEAGLPVVLFFSLIEGTDEHIVIFSTDLLNAANVTRFQREFKFKEQDKDIENMGDLLFYPDAIVITSSLANKLNLKLNSHLKVLAVDGSVDFVVKGIIAPEGPAKMLEGNFGLLPYQQAQRLLGVEGRILRLDLYLTPDMPDGKVSDQRKEMVAKAIQAKIPEDLLVEKHGDQVMLLEGGILEGTEITLGLGIAIALFAAMFMIYNTVSTSVVRRRREIGILRSIGVLRRQIAALFIGETVIMGILGTALGIFLGLYIEKGAIYLIHYRIHERFVKSFQLDVEPLTLTLIVLTFAVGIAVSVIAAFFPARMATHIAPVEAMRRVPKVITRRIHPIWFFLLGVLCIGVASYFGKLKPIEILGRANEPVGAYAGLFFLFLGFVLVCPGVTLFISTFLRPFMLRIAGLEGGLACDNLKNNLPRASVTISALMLGLVMTVNQSAVLESMKKTVNQWLDSIWNPDMVVMYGANAFGMMGLPIDANEALPKLSSLPEVEDINCGMFIPFWHEGMMIDALFEHTGVTVKHNRYVFREDPLPNYADLLQKGEGVLATEVFSLRTGKHTGDTVHIKTSVGKDRNYKIVGVIADFISANGAIIVDRAEAVKNWNVNNVFGFDIYFKPDFKIDSIPVLFKNIDKTKLEKLSLTEFSPATAESALASAEENLNNQIREGIWLSENFARKYRLKVGDTVQLRADSGEKAIVDFPVLGVLPQTEFPENTSAVAPVELWHRFWGERPSYVKRKLNKWMRGMEVSASTPKALENGEEFVSTIKLGPDFLRQRFQSALDSLFGANSHYGSFDPATIRKEVRRIMDVSFTTVFAIAFVAIAVALLGIVNTLLAAVLDRTRELGILRAIGGTRRQVRKTIIIEAGMMGAIAAGLGTAAGIMDSIFTILYQGRYIVGWVLTYVFPTFWIVGIFVAAVIASMLSGYYPARQATKMNIIEAIEYE